MNYEECDSYGIYKSTPEPVSGPRLMGADTLVGNEVYNRDGEDLGQIKEIMLDMTNGTVSYAVLASGGFLGIGERLFAVPWSALRINAEHKCIELDMARDRLRSAPGFHRDRWPDMADPTWTEEITAYYAHKPQWEWDESGRCL